MKIIIDPKAGCCMGVKRAIELAEKSLAENPGLYSLGEVIHNHSEAQRLKNLGLQMADSSIFNNPPGKMQRRVLVRAHGEPPATFQKARRANMEIIDGTCPVVVRSQKIAAKYYHDGYQIVIIGKKNHPEVLGIGGYCRNDYKVVQDAADVPRVTPDRKTFALAQTTISRERYRQLTALLKQRVEDLTLKDTVCKYISGRDRQVREFARSCGMVIMVGGRHSSNTKVLFNACREENPRSFWVEEPEQVNAEWFRPEDTVGITGSASTPHWLMEAVRDQLSKQFEEEKMATGE